MESIRVILLTGLLSLLSPLAKKVEVVSPSKRHLETKAADFPTPKSLADQKYFGEVLDINPSTIVGNFGEPRKSHFHTGLDFRTNQEEGHKVYAAAEGYISRINVSSGGYGNALYITHPNGYVTVYGHLKEFNSTIKERLRKEQYADKSFAIDFDLSSKELPVKKGDLIALSGNTGGSGGPHLHFEIRDTLERVYNPMLFGYKLKDSRKPTLSQMYFYPLSDTIAPEQKHKEKLSLKDGVYVPATDLISNVSEIGFSVNAYDMLDLNESHVGIYNLTVFDGDKMVYDFRFDRLFFPERRYVIAHIDYNIFLSEGRKSFHKCYLEPGNRCSIYSPNVNGRINLSDGKTHSIRTEITDANGNVAQLKFSIRFDTGSSWFKTEKYEGKLFAYNKENRLENDEMKLVIPKGCLLYNTPLNYKSSSSASQTLFSAIHDLGDFNTQTFDWFAISIKTNVPDALADKALVVCEDERGSKASKGGSFKNGWISAEGREFGKYYVTVDTSAPVIRALNVSTGKNMRSTKKFIFKLADNLSGVSKYDTYMDGNWVVTEFDGKTGTLTHFLDSGLSVGSHTFKIEATDERGNKSSYEVTFKM